MKEGYVHSEKFITYTLRLSFLPWGKKHQFFDEHVPVWDQLEDDGAKDYKFRYGLYYWSLQQGVRVNPDEHQNQSLEEMAAVLVRRDRLDEKTYKSYRKWVYKELEQLEIVLEENIPSQGERDKNTYLNSEN